MAIGEGLAKALQRGRSVFLFGELGAGKTTFVKGLAMGFGLTERNVTSPSFTIIAEYEGSIPIYHADLYRLEKEEEIEGTGFYDYLDSDGITVVEWAERLGGTVRGDVNVRIAFGDNDTRILTIEGIDEEDWNNLQKWHPRTYKPVT
ncbi:MAG: tRNA (adenosine(37)-N6)-threonylcarbamoyltransferase complex ATPase subunit type 1 TsaE [Nitrospirae bacterium]|nr:tRNA (adenosine(37)-N6)-threonylcarbamoyltransferase complex ATPase subunit type 1 TsaE [Nitrospirota bacterium]